MKKIVLFISLVILLIASSAFAVTATKSGNVVEITTLDADWNYTSTFTTGYENTHGIRVQAIIFYPSAANDILALEEGSDGPEIFPVKCNDTYDQRVLYLNGARIKPYFDESDSTIGTAANAKIVIILFKR